MQHFRLHFLCAATIRLTSTSTSLSAFFFRSYTPVSYYTRSSSSGSSRSNIPFTLIHTKSVVSHSLPKPIHFLCKPRCDAEKQRYRTRCYITVSSKNSESISGGDDDDDADDVNRKEVAKYEQTSDNRKKSGFFVYYTVLLDQQQRRSLTKISVKQGDEIDDIKKEIKKDSSNVLASVDAIQLDMFATDEEVEPLNALETWNPSVSWGTKLRPLMVKVNPSMVAVGKCISIFQ